MKNISKGEKVSLKKESFSDQLIIDINYDCPTEYSIDSSVLMLSQRNKLEEENDFIFYNNPLSSCNSVSISDQSGVKKRIKLDLSKVPTNISRLMFITTIDDGDKLNHHFNKVNNIQVNIFDNNSQTINYKIDNLTQETALILMEIYLHNNEWKIQATGNGFNSGLDAILKEYGSEKVQVQENNSAANIEAQAIPTPEPIKETINLSKVPSGTIDFVKKHNQRVDLVKKQINALGLPPVQANVVIVMDISGSMFSLFKKGVVLWTEYFVQLKYLILFQQKKYILLYK